MIQKIIELTRKLIGTNRMLDEMVSLKYEQHRNQLIEHILHDTQDGVSSERYCSHDVIISLTSYGRRVNDVAFTIESLMQQSVKANKIVLWLDRSFEDKPLPQSILNQQRRGLEIAFCTDVRSYKKLVPALRKYPDDAIITADDDLLYEYDLIERLVKAYIEQPQYIQACRVHKITLDKSGRPKPYNEWYKCYKIPGIDRLYFQTGCGGVLYPPHSLDEEVLNESVFMDICKYADDVWFYAMALKKGTLVNKIVTRNVNGDDYQLNAGVQDMGLFNINTMGKNLNDVQIKAVFDKYDLYDKLMI